jgi:hypothetical protein
MLEGAGVNTSRWQNKVRALFGCDENAVPTTRELLPTVPIEVDRPEWGPSGNEFRYMGWAAIAAGGAANAGMVALLNPAGSGILVVIELIASSLGPQIDVTGLSENTVTTTFTQVVVAGAIQPRDGLIGSARSAATLWTRNNAAPFSSAFRLPLLPTPLFLALRPGVGWGFESTALNTLFDASVAWRERPLEAGILG